MHLLHVWGYAKNWTWICKEERSLDLQKKNFNLMKGQSSKWQVDEMVSWYNGKLEVEEMVSWQNDNLMKNKFIKILSQNYNLIKWQVNDIASQWYSKAVIWQVNDIASQCYSKSMI